MKFFKKIKNVLRSDSDEFFDDHLKKLYTDTVSPEKALKDKIQALDPDAKIKDLKVKFK